MFTGWKRTKYLVQFDSSGNLEDHLGNVLGGSSSGDPAFAKWAQLDKATLTEHPQAQTPDAAQANWAATASLSPSSFFTRWVHCRDLEFNANDFSAATNGAVIKKIEFFVYLGTFTPGVVPTIEQTRLHFRGRGTSAATWADLSLATSGLESQGIYKLEWTNDGRLSPPLLEQDLNPSYAGFGLQFLTRIPADKTAAIYFDGIEARIEYENATLVPVASTSTTVTSATAKGNYDDDAHYRRGYLPVSYGPNQELGGKIWERPTAPSGTGSVYASLVETNGQWSTATNTLLLDFPSAIPEHLALKQEGNTHFRKVRLVVELQSNSYSNDTGELIIEPEILWPGGFNHTQNLFSYSVARIADDGTTTVTKSSSTTSYANVYSKIPGPLILDANNARTSPDGAIMFEWDTEYLTTATTWLLAFGEPLGGLRLKFDKIVDLNSPSVSVYDNIFVHRPRLSTLQAFGIDTSELAESEDDGSPYVEIVWDVLAGTSTSTAYGVPADLTVFTGNLSGTVSTAATTQAALGQGFSLGGASTTGVSTVAGMEVSRPLWPSNTISAAVSTSANLQRGFDQFFEPVTAETRVDTVAGIEVAYSAAGVLHQKAAESGELYVAPYLTGDTVITRLLRFLPGQWFGEQPTDAPNLADSLEGPAAALSHAFDLIRFAENNSKLANAGGTYLDIIANDFFGSELVRRKDEQDVAFRARIKRNLLREKVTRGAVVSALKDLTGADPKVFELNRSTDTGGYGEASHLAYGDSTVARVDPLTHPGGYGSQTKSHIALIAVSLPPPVGIPLIAGYSSAVGGYASVEFASHPTRGSVLWGAGNWAMAYASSVPEPDAITVEDVKETLNTFGGAGTQFWVNSSTRSA